MKQLKVGLHELLRHGLEGAAKDSGRSLADEVRTRLEFSFQITAIDPATRSVQGAIANIARRLDADCGAPWYVSPVTRQAFVAALTAVAAQIASKRNPWPERETNESAPERIAAVDAIGDPETIGRIRAQDEFMDATLQGQATFMRKQAKEAIVEQEVPLEPATKKGGEKDDDQKTGTRGRRNRRAR